MKLEYLNLTPHTINIRITPYANDGQEKLYTTDYDISVEPSGDVARVETMEKHMHTLPDGTPVYSREFGEVEGLPEPTENVIILVSSLVLSATNRQDVAAPDTGASAIRNADGQIEAVTRLIMNYRADLDPRDPDTKKFV